MVRRLALLGAMVAALAAAPSALAAPAFDTTLTTSHFKITYVADPSMAGHTTQMVAGDVGTWAERTLAAYKDWGYVFPDDGDGLIDVYILDFPTEYPQLTGTTGLAWPLGGLGTSAPGYVELDANKGANLHTVAHELFHVAQFGTRVRADGWLDEGTAEWAAYRIEGYPATAGLSVNAPDRPLDCQGYECGDNNYDRGAYPGWNFFEMLAERYGRDVVKDIIAQPVDSSLTATQSVLAGKGTTIGDAVTDYATTRLAGSFTIAPLQALAPPVYATVTAGTVSGAIPATAVGVNHLASRFVKIVRGDPTNTGHCYAATLALTVALPPGIGARPYFYWSGAAGSAIPFAISGSTATLTVPWDTCTWGSTAAAYVSLPNPSLSANSQEFTLGGKLTVDKSTLASAGTAPAPTTTYGAVVPAPTTQPAPDITVFGPELLRVGSKDDVLRLVVGSTGDGKVHAKLGGADLGAVSIQAGNNDVRFKLPPNVLAALRRTSSADALVLTSVSPSGAAGETVTRRLVVEAPAAKKKRQKHK